MRPRRVWGASGVRVGWGVRGSFWRIDEFETVDAAREFAARIRANQRSAGTGKGTFEVRVEVGSAFGWRIVEE